MVEKEFNLSEEIEDVWKWYLSEEYDEHCSWRDEINKKVKEFLRLDGEIIDDFIRGKITEGELFAKRVILIGEKLR